MSLKRSTAVTLATVAMTLGTTAPAPASPARDAGVANTPTPVFTSAVPSTSDGGTGTLLVVLLSAGALVAGAAAGFGGAKFSAGRAPLHPQ